MHLIGGVRKLMRNISSEKHTDKRSAQVLSEKILAFLAALPTFDHRQSELQTFAVAVAVAAANPRRISHEAARAWLLRLFQGDFEVPPPQPV